MHMKFFGMSLVIAESLPFDCVKLNDFFPPVIAELLPFDCLDFNDFFVFSHN